MENKKILITGCAGSIGSELVRQLAPKNDVYGIDLNETGFYDLYEDLKYHESPFRGRVGDIRNRETLESVFNWFKPEVVFHAAAYKHVTPMEHNPREAVETNVIGTCNIVDAAHRHNVERLVFISSDKAVGSNSVMGCTKRLGELVVKNAGYVSVRFGNVLGSRGSVIPIWQSQLDRGLPLTVTDERMERFFMSIEDAVSLVIEAGEIGEPGQIVILDMGKPVNVLQTAKEVLQKLGHENYPIRMIGLRPGETLTEKIMSDEEEKVAIKKDKFFIINARN